MNSFIDPVKAGKEKNMRLPADVASTAGDGYASFRPPDVTSRRLAPPRTTRTDDPENQPMRFFLLDALLA
ncbi:hypothetical protein ACQPYK_41810 [Streptosporangium sp. CA-135522]|uniref:hypothetical protein n=1 Tax=Streptosporangium sp. CA-135522 TaxID=3240072 RepID=UPI003D8BB320